MVAGILGGGRPKICTKKKPFKTTFATWAIGPSSWPRGAYLGWPFLWKASPFEESSGKKQEKEKRFNVSDHCRFSSWNMSFCLWKKQKNSCSPQIPQILATSILPIIFSTSGWISSRNPPTQQKGLSGWNFHDHRITSIRYFQDAKM